MSKRFFVYILSNKSNTVLYTGVTNDLARRAYEHRKHQVDGFTKKYQVYKLVYFEEFGDIRDALVREKQIKAGSKAKKRELVNSVNPKWRDMYKTL